MKASLMQATLIEASLPGEATAGPPEVGEWLAPMAVHWTDAAIARLAQQPAVVRITVTALRGSAPREPGASMLADVAGIVGTIGGGHMEWHAIRAARDLLREPHSAAVRCEELVLGPDLGQCCGGRVELWLERLSRADLHWLQAAARLGRNSSGSVLESEVKDGRVAHRLRSASAPATARSTARSTATVQLRRTSAQHLTLIEALTPQRPPLWIFGAGHVGQALVRLLADLSVFHITWIDSRPELLPAGLPDCVTTHAAAAPTDYIAAAAAGTRYIVLTHDHALDYELCRAILRRGDAAWLGLIGSASKAARFRSRLQRDGLSPETLAALTCPIGVAGIHSKLPAAIAISIAAQLLQQHTPVADRYLTDGHVTDRPLTDRHLTPPEQQTCAGSCASCGSTSGAAP